MRPDPTRPSSSSGTLGSVLHNAPMLALLVGLTGCLSPDFDSIEFCRQQHHGDLTTCCDLGWHADQGKCCPDGMHAIVDVENPDWAACVWDEDAGADAGVCLDASAAAEMDAGADAP